MPAPDDDTSPRGPERRPYVAPAIEETSDFETLALACNQDVANCAPSPAEPDAEPSS
jgi:hypothetical protein